MNVCYSSGSTLNQTIVGRFLKIENVTSRRDLAYLVCLKQSSAVDTMLGAFSTDTLSDETVNVARPSVALPSSRMMDVLTTLLEAQFEKFKYEMERIGQETVSSVHKALVQQNSSVADSIEQSHNLQMKAINALLNLQVKQAMALKEQQELLEGLPESGFWDAIADKVHFLEARIDGVTFENGGTRHKEDGQAEADRSIFIATDHISDHHTHDIWGGGKQTPCNFASYCRADRSCF